MKSALFVFVSAAMFAQSPHQHHAPGSAEEYIRVLNDPQRDSWQKPHDVVMALDLKPSDVVADIGAGSGYFSRRFAHHAAKVYAVDIDPKLVEASLKDAPKNVEGVLAGPDDPKLPSGAVDVVFFCDVLHHIENRAAYSSRVAKVLKPAGRIVVVDFYKKPLPVGPPEQMKISEEQMIEEMKSAGFRKTKSFDFLPYQYFLIFER